jgi:hypothetical protein
MVAQQRASELATDWRLVSLALDRLCFVLTLAATVVITAIVLHERPPLHNAPDIDAVIGDIMDSDPRRF